MENLSRGPAQEPLFIATKMEQDLKNLLKQKYNIDEKVSALLYERGYKTQEQVENFLNPTDSSFYNPFLLKDMDRLVERIKKAIEDNEKVLIFGDYDVDGVSASAILIKYFASINFYVDYFLPNRYVDGYGLTNESILFVKEKYNPTLIITVDCGISCYKEVEYAKSLGIDIVVTDHHDIPEILPDTIVVNAKLPNQKYPFNQLCGTGVAFKIVQALTGLEGAKKYLGICAIATIADIVPLIDENRAIVKIGMANFDKNLPIGIKMLMEENKLDLTSTSTDIAFKLTPKINAAGRMGDASVALKLYIKEDKILLKNTIENLNNLNLDRQALCNKVYEDVVNKLAKINIANYKSIVLYSKKWDSGILGIVCAKVAGEYNRPTILLSEVGDELKGSARSINDIDIFSAIASLKEVLETFGGHKMAAGLTIKKKNFLNFISSLNSYLNAHYSPQDFVPGYNYDMDVSANEITQKFVSDLNLLEPCGCGNPKPVFNLVLDKTSTVAPMQKHPNHLSILNKGLNIIAFNSYKYLSLLKNCSNKNLHIEFQLNSYKNKKYLKGVAKRISTGKLDKPKNNNVLQGEYLKQLLYAEPKNKPRTIVCSKQILNKLKEDAKKELFGTVFVCYSYNTYQNFVKDFDTNLQHYMYEIISNSGLNSIILAPINFNNFSSYKKIVFLDPVLSSGVIAQISKTTEAKIYIPPYKAIEKSLFDGITTDRQVFGNYFKIISSFSATQGNFYDEIDLFKTLEKMDKKINFKQFIFCLYTFIELNIFTIENEMELFSIKEDKKVVSQLTNSNFYNKLNLMLKTI